MSPGAAVHVSEIRKHNSNDGKCGELAGVSATAAAQVTEARKHQANDPKCSELGWVCVPMVVETYGAWGKEATAIISSVASRLATSTCRPKSTILHKIYGRLNLNLVCANATAILSRIAPPP
ncbi:hypothetical protein EMCRGX_G012934 [Ephydatia muelleri]